MKIGLSQPNGFPTHFAQQEHKYLDAPGQSKHYVRQISSMREGGSILMSIMEELLSQLPGRISLWWEGIPVSLKAIALSRETRVSWCSSLTKPYSPPQACLPISANSPRYHPIHSGPEGQARGLWLQNRTPANNWVNRPSPLENSLFP